MKLKELMGSLRTFEIYLKEEKYTISLNHNMSLNTNYNVSRMGKNKEINYKKCEDYDHV